MKEMTEHTPVPYRTQRMTDGDFHIICDAPKGTAFLAVVYREDEWNKRLPAEANAEFLVRAANAHAQLVEAVEAARDLIAKMLPPCGASYEWEVARRVVPAALALAGKAQP